MAATASDPYARAGVDTAAGDRAVELMKASVGATHGPEVLGGLGGFAGLWDASVLRRFRRPLLATSTDGVGTKVAIAQALDRHDGIGQDLVGMVVDDIVVTGARPLFMTDYIACGRVVPERISLIVRSVAEACSLTGVALLGGETAEHPDLLEPDEYDLAGAAVGAVEADDLLGAHRVADGDAVVAIASSGLHANGFSLVRRLLVDHGVALTEVVDGVDGPIGETLLTPTRLYSAGILDLLAAAPGAVHALSHVTGGGLAANLARVLPPAARCELGRDWAVPTVFRALARLGELSLVDVERVWNLGVGMYAVVAADRVDEVLGHLALAGGVDAWRAGTVVFGDQPGGDDWTRGGKGAPGGSVRLTGAWD